MNPCAEINQLRVALSFFEGQIAEEKLSERRWASREAEARAHKEKARAVRQQMTNRAQAILNLIYGV
ncbi:MAG: hypothetical protein KBD60_13370 [Sterolibacterium sp.]|jgi:hypothetical protein|nr:hypothetical protein [Sterolibacterium sp.]